MRFIEGYRKFRKAVLISLVLVEVVISAFIYLESTAYYGIYDILEVGLTFTLVFYVFMLSNDLEDYENEEVKFKFLSEISPLLLLLFINKSDEFSIVNGNQKKFGLPDNLTMENFKNLFTDNEWKKIKEKILEGANFNNEISGIFSFKDDEETIKYVRYVAKRVNQKRVKLNGVLFWFYDVTAPKVEELHLIHLFHKYRLMSYELDLVINALPIPVWRREENNEIIFCNQAYKDLVTKLGFNTLGKDIPEIDASIISSLSKQENDALFSIKKVFIIDNQPHVLKINESKIHSGGTIGFCYFINELEQVIKKNAILNHTLKNVLDSSNNAIFVVNHYGLVYLFNMAFINLFDLDQNWLATMPTFSSLIDKMREKGKLPEVRNYKDFKQQQMRYLTELTQAECSFIHLPNGKTLRTSVIPSQGGDTIFIYENISEQLILERAYNEQVNVIKSMISSCIFPIAIFSQNGSLYLYNNSFGELFGIDDELLQRKLHFSEILKLQRDSITNDDEFNRYKQALFNTIESRSVIKSSFKHVKKGNVEVSAEPLPDNSVMLKFAIT